MSATLKALNPPTVWQVPDGFKPVYTHATEATAVSRTLFVSGQFGVRPDGSLAEGFAAQAAQAMDNVESLLEAAKLDFASVAKLTIFLTRSTDAPDLLRLRTERWASAAPPAVTVITVSALAKPEYLIEIEATALA
jgi:enamine deaminase RidA (YjgF/YER057c/UK114 family)